MSKDERNIYDLVMIVYFDETDTYGVMNMQNITCWNNVWTGKDLATAKAVRKAYCDGYYDRKQEELENEKED